MESYWRIAARKIIEPIWEKHDKKDTKEFRQEVSKAYPWHPRSHHPYKIWLDEIKIITGKRKYNERKCRRTQIEETPKEQMKLW